MLCGEVKKKIRLKSHMSIHQLLVVSYNGVSVSDQSQFYFHVSMILTDSCSTFFLDIDSILFLIKVFQSLNYCKHVCQ